LGGRLDVSRRPVAVDTRKRAKTAALLLPDRLQIAVGVDPQLVLEGNVVEADAIAASPLQV
jgi:hypothetical protein